MLHLQPGIRVLRGKSQWNAICNATYGSILVITTERVSTERRGFASADFLSLSIETCGHTALKVSKGTSIRLIELALTIGRIAPRTCVIHEHDEWLRGLLMLKPVPIELISLGGLVSGELEPAPTICVQYCA